MTEWQIESFRSNHIRSDFSCGIASLDAFICRRVRQYEQRRLGKTYVAVATSSTRVLGYYTIAASSIPFESLPADLVRKLPLHPIPYLLLAAALAVTTGHQGRSLGEALLLNGLRRAEALSRDLRIHAVMVDSPDDRAIGFYHKYGFVPLQDQPRPLVLPVATIAASMANRR